MTTDFVSRQMTFDQADDIAIFTIIFAKIAATGAIVNTEPSAQRAAIINLGQTVNLRVSGV